jgi:hypothetical protein
MGSAAADEHTSLDKSHPVWTLQEYCQGTSNVKSCRDQLLLHIIYFLPQNKTPSTTIRNSNEQQGGSTRTTNSFPPKHNTIPFVPGMRFHCLCATPSLEVTVFVLVPSSQDLRRHNRSRNPLPSFLAHSRMETGQDSPPSKRSNPSPSSGAPIRSILWWSRIGGTWRRRWARRTSRRTTQSYSVDDRRSWLRSLGWAWRRSRLDDRNPHGRLWQRIPGRTVCVPRKAAYIL